jgi:hypothetical protein
MTSGQPDPSSLPRAAKSVLGRRGLMAGVAAATAGLLAYAQGRNTEVAYAVDGTFDNVNINPTGKVNIGTVAQNQFADIHTTTNLGGLRFYNAATLTTVPEGAALQFWGNGSGLPGRAFIDSGANNDAGIFFRTAASGGTVTERLKIDANGTSTFTGDVAISGMKQFVIDHPLDPDNQYLYHSVVEGPEQYNVYTGNVTTDSSGQAAVTLPAYFEAINRDLRYQLTVLGNFAQAIVATPVQNNQFTIRTDKPSVTVSWQVMGIRNDAYARARPFVAERPKTGVEVGSRLHPEVFNLPADRSVGNRTNFMSIINRPSPNSAPQTNDGGN